MKNALLIPSTRYADALVRYPVGSIALTQQNHSSIHEDRSAMGAKLSSAINNQVVGSGDLGIALLSIAGGEFDA